jgi:hypothetical protein
VSPTRRTRRDVLGLLAAAVGGAAGCAGGGSDGGSESPSDTGTTTETATAAAADRDLREANVVDVTVESTAEGYRFDVTLHHDDAGEDGYANWWQVETLDGDRLGRRDLAHPHGTRPFTRSATVSVPEGTACVVVRGHDRTHGYGGRAMVVDVGTGVTEAVPQGPERESTVGRACPNG